MKDEICYYCGEQASTKEHIPPECFFPKGNKVDLFTVPACEEHNNAKSKDDEYVKVLLTTSADLMLRKDLSSVIDKSERALERSPAFKATVLDDPEPALVILPCGTCVPSTSHKIDIPRLLRFLNFFARGLFFHHEKKVWKGSVQVAPHFLLRPDAEEQDRLMSDELLEHYDRENSHGINKNVFYYNFVTVFDDAPPSKILMYVLCVCLFDKFKVSLILAPGPDLY
jgi:hypothetical protein